MGAISFIHNAEGSSAKQAFEKLIEQANEECGTASYNGSINTCSMGGCTKAFDKYNKSNENKAYKIIEDEDNGTKWQADYIDLGVKYYEVLTAKKVNKEYKAKFKMKYIVMEEENFYTYRETNYYFDTKTQADKKAMELTLKNNKEYSVEKKYINTEKNGSCICSKIEITRKNYKSKPKFKDMSNRIINEVHEYIFYGWASC